MPLESGGRRTLVMSLPADLADWLDEQVSAMRFSSRSHGVARALAVYRHMPEIQADTYPVE